LKLVKQIGGVNTIDISRNTFTNDMLYRDALEKFMIDRFLTKGALIVDGDNASYYWITIQIKTKKYICIVEIKNTNVPKPIPIPDLYKSFILYFINTNCNEEYMKIKQNAKNIVDNLIEYNFLCITFSKADTITTNVHFDTFEGKSKLETALEIMEAVYKYFGKNKIELNDSSIFKCPSLIERKINICEGYNDNEDITYSAKVYRILKTNKSIDEISIYTKYDYVYEHKCDETILETIRNMSLQNFVDRLKIYVNDIYQKLVNHGEKYQKEPEKYAKQLDFLGKIRMEGEIYDNNQELIKLVEQKLSENKELTMHTFFKSIEMNDVKSCNSNAICFQAMDSLINIFSKINDTTNNTKEYDTDIIPIKDLLQYFNTFSQLLFCTGNLVKWLH
jgi:hypothetical protein